MTAQLDAATIEVESRAAGIQPPALYNHDERIASLVRRMRFMMTGAATAPDPVVWRAAQLCAIHNLDPFGTGDIYIWSPYGENCADPKKWIVHVGIAAWRRKAQDQAKYNIDPRLMRAEEVAAIRRELYHPDDVGVEMTLWRLDVARECRNLGIPYTPIVTQGIWRVNAYKENGGTYKPDQLANTETKEEKARKRAEMKALRIAFHLDMPTDEDLADAEANWRIIQDLEQITTTEERLRAMPHKPDLNCEPDGDILWA
jgi:hypothetical protein